MKMDSNFKLIIKTELSSADFKVLVFLYQPLIGIDTYSLYTTFYHLSKQNITLLHKDLFDILNLKQKDFLKMTEKLEAIGLLETYEKDGLEFVYILKPPYSAKKFLVDTFLGAYLESEIGSSNLKKLASFFKVSDGINHEFNNITKSFDDLYNFKTNQTINVDFDLESRNGNNTKLIKNGINYNEFVEKLPRSLKSPKLFNDNFKQQLIQIAYIYQFSIDDLINVYEKAHLGKNNIKISEVNFQAKQYFESENKQIAVEKKEITEEEALNSVPYIQIIEKYGINEIYHTSNALETVNEFINQNEIMQGTLNVLLIYILKLKEGVLPNVNYLNRVWQSWSSKGVRTVSDAIKFREDIEKNYQTNYKTKSKTVNKPEWIDKYMKELEEMEG